MVNDDGDSKRKIEIMKSNFVYIFFTYQMNPLLNRGSFGRLLQQFDGPVTYIVLKIYLRERPFNFKVTWRCFFVKKN